MPVSERPAVERVARVLAAQRLSAHARGDLSSAAPEVGEAWRDHLELAREVLRTLREPDARMAAAGDPAVWDRMARAAVEVSEDD